MRANASPKKTARGRRQAFTDAAAGRAATPAETWRRGTPRSLPEHRRRGGTMLKLTPSIAWPPRFQVRAPQETDRSIGTVVPYMRRSPALFLTSAGVVSDSAQPQICPRPRVADLAFGRIDPPANWVPRLLRPRLRLPPRPRRARRPRRAGGTDYQRQETMLSKHFLEHERAGGRGRGRPPLVRAPDAPHCPAKVHTSPTCAWRRRPVAAPRARRASDSRSSYETLHFSPFASESSRLPLTSIGLLPLVTPVLSDSPLTLRPTRAPKP
jgi:hypothetical protein